MPPSTAAADPIEVKALRPRRHLFRRLLLNAAIWCGLVLLWLNDLFGFTGESLGTRLGEVGLLTTLATLVVVANRYGAQRRRDLDRDRGRLAHLVDRIPLATVAIDAEARVVTWNPSAEQLFGWRADEVTGKPSPIVPPGQRPSSDDLIARIRRGEGLRGVEVQRLTRSGELIEVGVYSAPLGRGETLVLYDDIRERKRAERDRDEAQRRYRELIEAMPLVTYIDQADDAATNIFTSPQVVDLLGWSQADWDTNPHHFTAILHPEEAERVFAEVARANRTNGEFDSEYRLRHRDGHYVWVRDRSSVVDDANGDSLARGFLLDVTQRKELEEQLLQSQKMDAIGQLAGGIAHDFNNLLTGIGGYADLAASAEEHGPVVTRCLDGIRSAATEAASLTSRLLAFSRRNVPERRPVDLNAIVREASSLLERLVRADINVDLQLAPALPIIAADLAQLKQVVLNLALNARDAMPGGGTITIETAVSAGSVLLRVRDTGTGMDAATRSRALEPFFTTKPEGEGTGLGLSVAYGVVDGLGGRLSIDSALGTGTIVEIALPAGDCVPVDAAPGLDEGDGAPRTGRVLVAEDREVVRELARDVLTDAGYDVVAVAGGREALEEATAGAAFELLLTDVVMPEMSGPELATKLRTRFPSLPVLYMSGYTDDVLSAHELAQDATAFLRKPFANGELVAAVRGLLDDRSPAGAVLRTAESLSDRLSS